MLRSFGKDKEKLVVFGPLLADLQILNANANVTSGVSSPFPYVGFIRGFIRGHSPVSPSKMTKNQKTVLKKKTCACKQHLGLAYNHITHREVALDPLQGFFLRDNS